MPHTAGKTASTGWVQTARFLLIGYWITLFVATHIPRVPQSLSAPDKPLHFVAYAGLAFLLAAAVGVRRRLSAINYLGLWAVLLAYGAIDEWLQIPVGRSCELADWQADALGALAGIALYRAAAWLLAGRLGLFALQSATKK